MTKNCEICSNECCGVDGQHGSCCSIEDRDYIIGRIDDAEDFLIRLESRFGRKIKHEEVFIDYKEGRNTFPEKASWQKESHYPCMRLDLNHARKSCIFYNHVVKACSIYDIRPKTCEKFKCNFLIEMGEKEENASSFESEDREALLCSKTKDRFEALKLLNSE